MTAGYADLFVDRGADFSYTLNLTDDVTNAPINIANYQFYCTLKRSYYSQNTTANVTCTVGDAANGRFTISMDRQLTSNIDPGRYVFDVVSLNNDVVEKIIEGVMHVSPTVTIVD